MVLIWNTTFKAGKLEHVYVSVAAKTWPITLLTHFGKFSAHFEFLMQWKTFRNKWWINSYIQISSFKYKDWELLLQDGPLPYQDMSTSVQQHSTTAAHKWNYASSQSANLAIDFFCRSQWIMLGKVRTNDAYGDYCHPKSMGNESVNGLRAITQTFQADSAASCWHNQDPIFSSIIP